MTEIHATETEKIYLAALRLIELVSDGLDHQTIHLRDNRGQLLDKLDQVLIAIDSGTWPVEVSDGRN